MQMTKNPEKNLKLQYRKTLEFGLIVSLALNLVLFLSRPQISLTPGEVRAEPVEIEVQDIPPTEQIRMPVAPARPTVPIPTESEEIPEDLTIETTELDLDLSKLPPPPPPGEGKGIEDAYVFVPYDEAPYPIGGYEVIKKNLRYPEIARKAGIEAHLVVGVLINEAGNSVKTQILKSSGMSIGFEEAAQKAIMAVKWRPAKQRDKPVKVWVSIPISFKLGESKKKVAS